MLRAGRKSRGGSNTTLLLIALGLACLVAVVAVHRGMFGQVPGKPIAKPLPTIVKPGEIGLVLQTLPSSTATPHDATSR